MEGGCELRLVVLNNRKKTAKGQRWVMESSIVDQVVRLL